MTDHLHPHLSDELLQRLGAGEPIAGGAEQAHLAACEACQVELESWRRLCAELGALESPDPGPDFAAAVLARLDGPEAVVAPTLGLKGWALGLVAASLAAGLLAFFGTELLADLPALVARGLGAAGATLAAALAVLDGLAAAIPEGASAGLLVIEVLFFAVFARYLLRHVPLPSFEESSR